VREGRNGGWKSGVKSREAALMGLLDSLGLRGALEGAAASAAPALIAAALAKTNFGLQGVVNQLQKNGVGSQVTSWLGTGDNISITPDELRNALRNEHVKQIATHFWVSTDEALKILSDHLPAAVDQASPNGQIYPQ
jgi:uncharacterized protein YidB (DUF937 family)